MGAKVIGPTKEGQLKRGSSVREVQVIGLLVVLVLIPALFWVFSTTSHRGFSPSSLSAGQLSWPLDWWGKEFISSPGSEAGGPVYSYSVIPGGVASARKLQDALRQDRVAAAHYADFHAQSARVIRLATEREVYVSYRLGNRIYWTRKKVRLHAGETLLTDGEHMARTRCGNRISEIPDGPASPDEPPADVLNRPVMLTRPEITTDSVPVVPIWTEDSPPTQFALGNPPQSGVPGGNGPFLPPFPPPACCGGSSGPPPSTGPPPPYSGPPTATPEPGSFALLAAGLASIVFLWKFRRF
jgi:PEP-CTERM motif